MTDNVYRIPLANVPQRFQIDISGQPYIIVCRWNESIGWTLDISNGTTEAAMIRCLPLVVGSDLLGQYGYLGVGAEMYVYTDGDQYAVPTLENLGTESNVYLVIP